MFLDGYDEEKVRRVLEQDAREEGMEKGMAEGREAQAKKTALNLIKAGMSVEQIASVVEFSSEKIKEWVNP